MLFQAKRPCQVTLLNGDLQFFQTGVSGAFYFYILKRSGDVIHPQSSAKRWVWVRDLVAIELGYNSLKPQQLEVAVALVEGRHILCCSPTNYGKSSYHAMALDKDPKKERGYSLVVVVSPCVSSIL